MMKITAKNSLPLWLWSMINNILRTYRTFIKNKTLYTSKLDNLKMVVELIDDGDTTADCTHYTLRDDIDICFFVNIRNSKKFIAFILLHELTHFLFVNPFDKYGLSGKASDGSTNLTAVQRIDKSRNRFAYYLEELIVNYIAKLLIKKFDYPDTSSQYTALFCYTADEVEVIETWAGAFGPSLRESCYIDCVVTNSGEESENYFWDSLMAFSFNNIVDIYEEIMGAGAFRKLCDKIDEYGNATYGSEESCDYQASTRLMDEIKSEIAIFCEQVK